jgi:uncharacterized membrane protein YqjE
MATVHRLSPLSAPARQELETVAGRFWRLVRLEVELALAETHQVFYQILFAVAVAVPAAIAFVASLVVLIASGVAPFVNAPWQHLAIAGGGVAVVSIACLFWSLWRLRHLEWPRQTLTSFEENRQWLGAQLKSRLTLR